jgi:hypothetical protein
LIVGGWWERLTTNNQQNIRSPLITALGLSLLLRADHWTTMVLAAVIAIASKFVFKIGYKIPRGAQQLLKPYIRQKISQMKLSVKQVENTSGL